MNPALLALFTRALDLDARNFATYATRMAMVFVFIFFLGEAQSNSLAGAPGLGLFTVLGYVTLAFISLAGILLFSTVISEEKEEMTIGLLKMTGLNPISIILGKGASRILAAMLLLLAQFPFTLLTITLGGVSLGQVLAEYVMLMSYVVLMGGMGLLSSVVCRRSATAIAMTLLLIAGFYLVPWLGGLFLDELASAGAVAKDGTVYSALHSAFEATVAAWPFYRFGVITETGFDEGAFGWQAWSNLGAGVALILLSWALFERATSLDRAGSAGRGAALLRVRLLRIFGSGRVWRRALVWKEFHFGIGGWLFMLGRLLAVGVVAGIILHFTYPYSSDSEYYWSEVGGGVMVISFILCSLDLLAQSARTFNTEWRQKTLPELALLPISTHRLVIEKFLGSVVVIVPYALVFLAGMSLLRQEDLGSLFEHVFISMPFAAAVMLGIAFLYLNVYASLWFKWVGVLVSVGVFWLLTPVMMFLIFAGLTNETVVSVILMQIALVAIVLLHVGTVRLIERRAGE